MYIVFAEAEIWYDLVGRVGLVTWGIRSFVESVNKVSGFVGGGRNPEMHVKRKSLKPLENMAVMMMKKKMMISIIISNIEYCFRLLLSSSYSHVQTYTSIFTHTHAHHIVIYTYIVHS